MLLKYLQYLRRHPLPVWAGLSVIGALQLRRVLQRQPPEDDDPEHPRRDDLIVAGYKALPLRTLSRCWGSINDVPLPVWSRPLVLGCYAKLFRCNLDESEETDLRQYRNLGEFFRRRLKPGARSVDDSRPCIVSPCDGRVLHFGHVSSQGRLQAIKGVHYPLKEFLGFVPEMKENAKLYYYVIYLAPGDYHGFHSPACWNIQKRIHFEGYLLSVSPSAVKKVPKLFNINERVVYTGTWEQGFFSMTAVGATNVGSVVVPIDTTLKTNCKTPQIAPKLLAFDNLPLSKGEYFGEFNLGSSIVVIFEALDAITFRIKEGDSVQMGKCIADIGMATS